MEIELKFLVEEQIARDKILQDSHLQEMTQEGSYEEIEMDATYFDTEALDLCKRNMALRVRFENGKPVATLKWGGSSDSGLHIRGELNVPLDEEDASEPSLEIFRGSDIFDEIMEAAGGKRLRPLMQMQCLRKQIMVDTGKSISAVSLDVGEIVTSNGNADISELEVELYSGDRDDMIELGRELAAKYNLKEGSKSKFQVGLELLGK